MGGREGGGEGWTHCKEGREGRGDCKGEGEEGRRDCKGEEEGEGGAFAMER